MNKLDRLREQFEKQRVLEMPVIMRLLGTTSRMTAYRYLKKLNHLSSYTHNGKFYTLLELAKFDATGLYSLREIGFSKYGTLSDTIAHAVEESEAGKTSSELENQYHVRVKNALLDLVETNRIDREMCEENFFIYLSVEHGKRQQQLKKRKKGVLGALPEWLVIEVLVEMIRTSAKVPQAHVIASRLLKRGSRISQEQVQQVLEIYDLEKKTLDCEP